MSGTGKKWWLLFLLIITGTLAGFYLQEFQFTSSIFRDFVSLGVNIEKIDIGFIDTGFRLNFQCNLGTVLGAITGLWIIL